MAKIVKLSNNFQYSVDTVQLPESCAEYLIQQGYNPSYKSGGIQFQRGNTILRFVNDNLDVYEIDPSKEYNKEVYRFTFTGSSKLEIVAFAFLMQSMGVASICDLEKNAAKISAQHATEAKMVFKIIHRHLQVA